MKKLLTLSLVLGLVAWSGVANAQLVNGNLDLNTSSQFDAWTIDSFKTNTGPDTDILTSEGFIEIGPVTSGGGDPDRGAFFKAFQGNPNTGNLATAHMYQSIPGAASTQYTLTGWWGAGANYSGLTNSTTLTEMAIEYDTDTDRNNGMLGSTILDIEGAGLATGGCCAFGAQQFSVSGTSPAGTLFVRARASMINGNGTTGGDQAVFADDFTLGAIPEPTSALLGLLGLASVFGMIRRR